MHSSKYTMKLASTFLLGTMLIFFQITFAGCATVVRGTNTIMIIESDPPGALVEMVSDKDGVNWESTTPATFKVPRKHTYTVTIVKEGYKPLEVDVINKMSGDGRTGLVGNILLGGPIGAVVDVESGATQDLFPNPIKVDLIPIEVTDNPESVELSE